MQIEKLYGGEVAISFEPGRHKYSHEKVIGKHQIGDAIMSVTKALKVLDKAGLVWWAAGMAAEHIFENWSVDRSYSDEQKLALVREAYMKHRAAKEAKAEKGSEVHNFAEAFVLGKKPPMPDDPNIRNGANAFMKWWAETELEPIKTEGMAYSKKLDIAGRIDLVAKSKNPKSRRNGYHIVDYKAVSMYKRLRSFEYASYQANPEGWPKYKKFIPSPDGFAIDKKSGEKVRYPVFDGPILQVSAYRAFKQEETGKDYGESYVVRFDQEFGDFDVTVLSPEFQDKAFEAYKHLAKVAQYLEGYGVKI